jgi:hypothetical protein
VHEGDPAAVLYLNDYDILTGRRLDDYRAHIRAFLVQGVAWAGIGVQGHLHGDTFDPAALREALAMNRVGSICPEDPGHGGSPWEMHPTLQSGNHSVLFEGARFFH